MEDRRDSESRFSRPADALQGGGRVWVIRVTFLILLLSQAPQSICQMISGRFHCWVNYGIVSLRNIMGLKGFGNAKTDYNTKEPMHLGTFTFSSNPITQTKAELASTMPQYFVKTTEPKT